MEKLLLSATMMAGLLLVAADAGPKPPKRMPPMPRQYAIEVTDEALEALRSQSEQSRQSLPRRR